MASKVHIEQQSRSIANTVESLHDPDRPERVIVFVLAVENEPMMTAGDIFSFSIECFMLFEVDVRVVLKSELLVLAL